MGLTFLGDQEKNIRELLGYNQDEMAELLGISKAFLVSLEQTPDKMSKILAISLVVNVFYEITRRIHIVRNIDFNTWDTKKGKNDIIKSLIDIKFNKGAVSRIIRPSSVTTLNFIPVELVLKSVETIKMNFSESWLNILFNLISTYEKETKNYSQDNTNLTKQEDTNSQNLFTFIMNKLTDKLLKLEKSIEHKVSSSIENLLNETFVLLQIKVFLIFLTFAFESMKNINIGINEIKDSYTIELLERLEKLKEIDIINEFRDSSFVKLFDVYFFVKIIHRSSNNNV